MEHREGTGDPNVVQPRDKSNAWVGESDTDSEVEFQNSRENFPPGGPAASTAVSRFTSTTTFLNSMTTSQLVYNSHASQNAGLTHSVIQQDVEDSGEYGAMDSGDLLEDAKFYQDTAIEYQDAYKTLCHQQEELQSRYT